MVLTKDNQDRTDPLPAEGRVYFLNAGLKQYASNHSDQDRLHLIVDMHEQKCLNYLKEID